MGLSGTGSAGLGGLRREWGADQGFASEESRCQVQPRWEGAGREAAAEERGPRLVLARGRALRTSEERFASSGRCIGARQGTMLGLVGKEPRIWRKKICVLKVKAAWHNAGGWGSEAALESLGLTRWGETRGNGQKICVYCPGVLLSARIYVVYPLVDRKGCETRGQRGRELPRGWGRAGAALAGLRLQRGARGGRGTAWRARGGATAGRARFKTQPNKAKVKQAAAN